MSVYNGAARLPDSLDSILRQTEPDFELIIVNDGSTDATAEILAKYANGDTRIRILTQENRGLTHALITGCAAASSEFIARQDCGDVSLPDRLSRQIQAIRDDVVLVSCSARYTGPEGELLYVAAADGDEIRRGLLTDGIESIRGLPHHGTALFRRDAYVIAGGYRDEFRYAQDLDLWIRIARLGRIVILEDILYEATYDHMAISASKRRYQVALAGISIAIRDGGDPRSLLEKAVRIGEDAQPRTRRDEASSLYFLASCLRRNGDLRYKRYARDAIRHDPLNLRAWLLLLR
jgi:glycosyltransferase involved in cell wall biosynthesis